MKRFYSIIVCLLMLTAGLQAQLCTAISPGTQATPTATTVVMGSMNPPTGLTGQSTGAGIVTEYILTNPQMPVVDTGYDATDPNDFDTSGDMIMASNATGQFNPMGMFAAGENYCVTAYTYELAAVQTAIDNITGSAACCSGITAIVETVILNGPLPGGLDICQLFAAGGINSGADVTSLTQVLGLVQGFGGINTIPAISNFLAAASTLSGSSCVGVTACGNPSNTVCYGVVAPAAPVCTPAVIATNDNTTICVDGVPDPINVMMTTAPVGDATAWVITDTNGMVLGLPAGGPFDLDGAGLGTCLIWLATISDPNFTIAVGDDAPALIAASSCAALSNSITVNRVDCTPTCDVVISEVDFDCDEDAGVFVYTWSITGGSGSYTVSGSGANAVPVTAGVPFQLSFLDGTPVSITATDTNGCTDTWSVAAVGCSKSCPGDITVSQSFDCDEASGVFTYTFTLGGGVPSTDATETYTVTGSGIGAPLAVAFGSPFSLSFADGNAVQLSITDSAGCTGSFDSGGPVACVKDDCNNDITIASVFDCDEDAGVFTYTFTLGGGAPSTSYTVTGSGISAPLSVAPGAPFSLSFTDGASVNLTVTDGGNCSSTFSSGGPVACSKGSCPGDITITPVFDCDEDAGIFTYTFTLSGGVPGTDASQTYTVSGSGIGAPLAVAAGSPFSLSFADGASVQLTVSDTGGCTASFSSGGPVACSKGTCDDDITISQAFDCDEDAGIFTYTFTLGGGAPASDPSQTYTVSGSGIGAPLSVAIGSPFSLSFTDGTSVQITATDGLGCSTTFDSGGPVACSKGCTCSISPAQILWDNGQSVYNVCEGAASSTGTVTVVVPPSAPNGAFIVTDGSGTQILEGPVAGPTFDFSNAPAGTCQVWHVAWDCELTLPTSNLVADIVGDCWMLSNPITVVRAPIDGGKIEDGPTGSESIVVCTDSETLGHKVTVNVLNPPTGSQSAFIITDETGTTIVGGPSPGPIFDFFGAGIGTCLIWQVTWNGDLNIPDNSVANISGDCWALSNPITVFRIDCVDDGPQGCLSIGFPSGPFSACSDQAINGAATITMNTTQASVISYGIYSGPNGTGTLLASNNTGVFSLSDIPGGSINTSYYIAAITGDDANGDGIPDAGVCNQSWAGPAVSWTDCSTGCASVAITQGTQIACPGQTANAVATVSGGTAGQAIVYVVHDGTNGSLGNILASNSTGVFSSTDLNAPSFSAQYNLSVLVGPDNNGDGFPDNNDPCFQVTYGPFVTFLGDVFINTEIVCDDNTGEATLIYNVQGGLPSFDEFAAYTVTGNGVNGTFTASQMPIQVVYGSGETSVSVTASDPFCGSSETASFILDCIKTPIELSAFDATARTNDNLVTWTTATELNNDYFVLERSFDGFSFEPIQTIDGAGSTIFSIDYSYTDSDVENSGNYYYRLTQFDYDGLSTTSDVVYVRRGADESTFGVSPVPATSVINVFLNDFNLDEKVTVSIYDISGKEIERVEGVGLNSLLQIDISYMASGVYFVSANDGNFVSTTKFIKE